MGKEVIIKVNNEVVFSWKIKVVFSWKVKKDVSIYQVLFDNRNILRDKWIIGIDEYNDSDESYFTNDIRDFIILEEWIFVNDIYFFTERVKLNLKDKDDKNVIVDIYINNSSNSKRILDMENKEQIILTDENINDYCSDIEEYITEKYWFYDNCHIDYIEIENNIALINGVFREREPEYWNEYEKNEFPDDVDSVSEPVDALEKWLND